MEDRRWKMGAGKWKRKQTEIVLTLYDFAIYDSRFTIFNIEH